MQLETVYLKIIIYEIILEPVERLACIDKQKNILQWHNMG